MDAVEDVDTSSSEESSSGSQSPPPVLPRFLSVTYIFDQPLLRCWLVAPCTSSFLCIACCSDSYCIVVLWKWFFCLILNYLRSFSWRNFCECIYGLSLLLQSTYRMLLQLFPHFVPRIRLLQCVLRSYMVNSFGYQRLLLCELQTTYFQDSSHQFKRSWTVGQSHAKDWRCDWTAKYICLLLENWKQTSAVRFSASD